MRGDRARDIIRALRPEAVATCEKVMHYAGKLLDRDPATAKMMIETIKEIAQDALTDAIRKGKP